VAKWVVEGFGGIRPRVSTRLLADNEAQVASNARLESAELRGWPLPLSIESLGGSGRRTIYRFGGSTWLKWNTDVDVARSPVEGDVTNRTYYTGDGVPKGVNTTLVAGNSFFALGIPPPTNTPSVTAPALKSAGAVINPMTATNGRVRFSAATTFNQGGQSDDTFERSADGLTLQTFVFSEFIVGLTVKVASVIDADTFTIANAFGGTSICGGDDFASWRVAPYSTGASYAVTGEPRMPNGLRCSLVAHGLRANDILTVEAVPTTPQWSGGRGILTAPVTGDAIGEYDFRANDGSTDIDTSIISNWSFSVARDEDLVSARSYVFTWVTDLGEESAPSPPSDSIVVKDGDTVTLSGWGTPPSTNRVITHIRIYRTAVGATDTDFQFVAEITAGTGTYNDSIIDAGLGELLQTASYDEPPADMFGIMAAPNGFLAGFSKNTVCLSEPGYPHAWPVEYRLTTDTPIVGGAVAGQSVFVLTEETPYVISGAHPRNMGMRKIDALQACVSKRSIVPIGGDVYYASPNGLVRVGPGGIEVVTGALLSREQWKGYYPATMLGANFNGTYFGFYDGGSAPLRGGIVYDPREQRIHLTTTPQFFVGRFTDPATGDLYVTDGENVLRWGDGAQSTFTWASKLFGAPYPLNLGAVRVVATSYPVTFTLRSFTGAALATRTVATPEPVRLPNGTLYNQFYLEVTAGTGVSISTVAVAETLEELRPT